ncbi:DUF4113 domain-containing protein [Methylorubrum extorquens]
MERGTVGPTRAELERQRKGWATKSEMRTPRYTTQAALRVHMGILIRTAGAICRKLARSHWHRDMLKTHVPTCTRNVTHQKLLLAEVLIYALACAPKERGGAC